MTVKKEIIDTKTNVYRQSHHHITIITWRIPTTKPQSFKKSIGII